jgi:2-oxoglutarate-Fe(II)-dependent dioxygenase family protein
VIELRVRTRLSRAELEPKQGMVLGPRDFDVLLTGAARILKPDGKPLCVYLPGVLKPWTDNDTIYGILHELRTLTTNNRGMSSGGGVARSPSGKRYAPTTASTIVGSFDPNSYRRYCRLTAWTGKNLPKWAELRPFLAAIGDQFARYVPERHRAQVEQVRRTQPAWVIEGTPFTTITVNNTYPTGMHTDKGDLDEGFSTLACLRRGGPYTGGNLMFPEYRVAVDMKDGDLLLMDAHEWHANADIVCGCGTALFGMCERCGAERISVVSYFRTAMVACGDPATEEKRAADWWARRGGADAHLQDEEAIG